MKCSEYFLQDAFAKVFEFGAVMIFFLHIFKLSAKQKKNKKNN